ncbi:hypothetical protein ACFFX1_26025 [Dactylosporangium sucinum]|nr:hypothetical protein [Dactylosporangium sucinum]
MDAVEHRRWAAGGMSDCTAMFVDVPGPDLREAVLDAVSATLALRSR